MPGAGGQDRDIAGGNLDFLAVSPPKRTRAWPRATPSTSCTVA